MLAGALVFVLWGTAGRGAASAGEAMPSEPELRLSLRDAIQAALDNNSIVRLLKERIAAAQAAADHSFGALMPNLSGFVNGRNQTVNLATFGIPPAAFPCSGSRESRLTRSTSLTRGVISYRTSSVSL